MRARAILLTAIVALAPLAIVPAAAEEAPQEGPMTVTSFDGTAIDIIVCKPPSASAANPAPVILHSHGWGGSRSNCGFGQWLDAGFGVVSISQRGFGASGGQAHVHDPDFEGRDNIAVIDLIATFDWVAKDGPDDPVLGAIGGSYGGGYQFLTALTEIGTKGETRLDALSPEITWFDLPQSLAPNGVVRSVWVDALYAVGSPSVHNGIHEAFAYSLVTGQLPDGTVPGTYNLVEDFHENSPVGWLDQGVQLDIPVLMRQGLTDNLFNLNQAWHNFEDVLTDEARAGSTLIGYNGGHVLPTVLPPGTGGSGDPCTAAAGYSGFTAMQIAFFEAAFAGQDTRLTDTAYMLATVDNGCVAADDISANTAVNLDGLTVTTTAAGPIQHIPLVEGPLTIAGIPTFSATTTALGADARAFLALAVGTGPTDAQVLDHNVMPVRSLLPIVGEQLDTELAGVAADIGDGETLFLTVTPVDDMFVHHGSRTPGGFVFEDIEVGLPVQG